VGLYSSTGNGHEQFLLKKKIEEITSCNNIFKKYKPLQVEVANIDTKEQRKRFLFTD
jgi:hypothetical protein